MNANNIVAEAIESHNVITFSQQEMAFNILGLVAPAVNLMCQDDTIYADLTHREAKENLHPPQPSSDDQHHLSSEGTRTI